MNLAQKYKVILWDFDGVIMDSMSIRDLGFVKTLEKYPKEQVDLLLNFHRNNGGLSRYVKFRYFYEEIRKENVSEENILELAGRFSEIMLSLLIDEKLLIEDSVSFIKAHHHDFRFHIVSGSDGKELNKICEALELTKYFFTIEGSPTPKKALVKGILENNSYQNTEICLIGDSINDFEAAQANKIEFIGYNNLWLQNQNLNYIKKFGELNDDY